MQTIIERVMGVAKKALRLKSELERLTEGEKRIYELSRMLPDQEGYELVKLYHQNLKDIKKVTEVMNESEVVNQ